MAPRSLRRKKVVSCAARSSGGAHLAALLERSFKEPKALRKVLTRLAGAKQFPGDLRAFFLKHAENGYDPLLWNYYLSQIKAHPQPTAKTERIVLVGSFNLAPLQDKLAAIFDAHGVNAETALGDHNNPFGNLLNEQSAVSKFSPSIVLLVLSFADLFSKVYDDPSAFSPEGIHQQGAAILGQISGACEAYFSRNPKGAIHLALLPSSDDFLSSVYSPASPTKAGAAFRPFHMGLLEIARRFPSLFVVDSIKLLTRHALRDYEDIRFWYLAQMRFNDRFFADFAREVFKLYRLTTTPAKKCLVVDLDNVLWGGVIGQDGLEGITLGQDGLGKAYQDVQKELVKLHHRGVLLAIASKNNAADVEEAFKKHPEMIVKEEHFLSKKIDWKDKAANVAEIAEELKIGLDSLVFLDDNPVERDWIRRRFPQVTVPDLPEDPFFYPRFLREGGWFDSYDIQEEDRTRNKTYRVQKAHHELKSSAKSFEEYLEGLNQKVELAPVTEATLARAAQLAQKTNQFNLTTIRYTQPELKGLLHARGVKGWTVRVEDRFCDYGIVGLVLTRHDGASSPLVIDSFILSCRVIGRGVETAVLDALKETCRKGRIPAIEGVFRPTAKNEVAKDLYLKHGFKPVSESPEELRYRLALEAN